MENTQVKPIMGKRLDNQKLREVTGEDPWKDSPFYGAGDEAQTDEEGKVIINPIPVGGLLAGRFYGLRESKKANSSGSKSKYACMETVEGEKFRVFAPTMLANVLEREAELKQYVELEYTGKKDPVDGGRAYHNFTVRFGDTLN